MTDETRTFRMSFVTVYVTVLVWVNVTLILIYGLPLLLFKPPVVWWVIAAGVGLGMLIGSVVQLGLCGLMVRLLPTVIRPDRLQSPGVFGRKRFAAWADIRGVRPVNLLGLRYLVLTVEGQKRPLWLALFVRDKAGLIDAVADAAGDDHLLTQALRAHLGEREWQDGG